MPTPTFGTAAFNTAATAIPDQRQWLRKCSLVVGDAAGNALDLSDLQIKFVVSSRSIQSLKRLDVRIYNLKPETAQKIQQEFVQVELSAGYQGSPFGVIFSGLVSYFRRGKEDAVTSYLDIVAADCDNLYNWGTVRTTLAAGASLDDQLQAVLNAIKPFGITLGNAPTLKGNVLPRSKTYHGMVRDVLREIAAEAHVDWFFEDKKLNLIPPNGWREGGQIILTPGSGLVGVPEQTLDGVNVRCLLNPDIQVARLVQIDSSLIATTKYTGETLPNFGNPFIPDLSATGKYKIYALRQTGDTRGQEWYSEAVCVALNPAGEGYGPISSRFKEAIGEQGQQ